MQRKLILLGLVLMIPAALSLACGNRKGSNMGASAMNAVIMTGQIVGIPQMTGEAKYCAPSSACPAGCVKDARTAFYNDADKQIYTIYTKQNSESKIKLADFLAKRVEVSALVHKTSGFQGVEIQSIKVLKDTEKISQLR